MKFINMTFPATVVASILILFLPLAAADDYTLARCRELALKNNVAVRNADLEVAAARELKRSAFTRYFPSVSASGLAMSFDDPVLQLGSMSLLDKLTLGSVTVVQPLFAGGRIIAGNKLAEVGRQASEQKRRLSENETLLKTEEQYWLIVSLDEKVKTLDLYTQMLDDLGKTGRRRIPGGGHRPQRLAEGERKTERTAVTAFAASRRSAPGAAGLLPVLGYRI